MAGRNGHGGQVYSPTTPATSTLSTESTRSTRPSPATYPEIAANAALVLIAVACSLLDRQLAAQARAFEKEGGFTERIYRRRIKARGKQWKNQT